MWIQRMKTTVLSDAPRKYSATDNMFIFMELYLNSEVKTYMKNILGMLIFENFISRCENFKTRD